MSSTRIAIKQLTQSDLSLFSQHVRDSKQKGVNLNRDVFVDQFYPALADRPASFTFPLSIGGPGNRNRVELSRAIRRTAGAKNWRLNGEVIDDRQFDPGRYDRLVPGDLAVLSFEGTHRPDAVSLILVSAIDDQRLHAAIMGEFSFGGRQTMVPASDIDVSGLIEQTIDEYRETHPLDALVVSDSIQDVIYGSASSQLTTAAGDGLGVAISYEQLLRQVRSAEDTGRRGEEVFSLWLSDEGQDDESVNHVSDRYARAAFDFFVDAPVWEDAAQGVYVDVKTTRSEFATPLHMSMAEVRWAAKHANYRIARVFAFATNTPRVTLLSGVHEHCRQLLNDVVARLPQNVAIDGFTMNPGEQFRVVAGDQPSTSPLPM